MQKRIWFALALAMGLGSAAPAMDFACSGIDGAGGGDFEFSRICLNDEYAVLRTGTFESTHYLYRVRYEASVNNYTLTPQKYNDPNWREGRPVVVTVVDSVAPERASLVNVL